MQPYSKKYWKDYELTEEPDGRGGYEKVLKYIGPLYERNIPDNKLRRQKVITLFEVLFCDAAFLLAVTRPVAGNMGGLSSVFGLVLVFPLFFINAGCFNGLWRIKEMTYNEYRSSSLFIKYGSAAGVLLGLLKAVLTAVEVFSAETLTSLIVTAFTAYAAVPVICTVLLISEIKTDYKITPGKNGVITPNRHLL